MNFRKSLLALLSSFMAISTIGSMGAPRAYSEPSDFDVMSDFNQSLPNSSFMVGIPMFVGLLYLGVNYVNTAAKIKEQEETIARMRKLRELDEERHKLNKEALEYYKKMDESNKELRDAVEQLLS